MALPEQFREVPHAPVTERIGSGLRGLTSKALIADHLGLTGIVTGMAKANQSVAKAADWLPFVSGPSAVETGLAQAGGIVQTVGGLAPALAAGGDGFRAIGNLRNGNFGKVALNVTAGATKVAAVAVIPAALAVELGSWALTGKSTLTHIDHAVESVFGMTGEVTPKVDPKSITSVPATVAVAGEQAAVQVPVTPETQQPSGQWTNLVANQRGQRTADVAANAVRLDPEAAASWQNSVEAGRAAAASGAIGPA